MAIGLVPSCPETGLGTGRGPSGARMNRPGCPGDDRRGAGPARPEPGARHPDPQVAHRYQALSGRRAAAASTLAATGPAATAVTVAACPVPTGLAGIEAEAIRGTPAR